MKFESSFEPLSFWAQGPWVFFNLGLKFMQTWQNECFSRLRLMPLAVPAARSAKKTDAVPSEIAKLGAEIAARQGREAPLLGCLQNVKVVGGPELVEAPVTAPVKAPAKTVKPAAPKAAAPAARVAAEKQPAVVVPKSVPEVEVAAPVVVDDQTSAAAASSVPSVTSMLAMQAKSLAKAVKTSPVPVAAKSANKPVAKVAAQSPAKAVAKVAAPAVEKAPAKAKAVAKAKPASKKA